MLGSEGVYRDPPLSRSLSSFPAVRLRKDVYNGELQLSVDDPDDSEGHTHFAGGFRDRAYRRRGRRRTPSPLNLPLVGSSTPHHPHRGRQSIREGESSGGAVTIPESSSSVSASLAMGGSAWRIWRGWRKQPTHSEPSSIPLYATYQAPTTFLEGSRTCEGTRIGESSESVVAIPESEPTSVWGEMRWTRSEPRAAIDWDVVNPATLAEGRRAYQVSHLATLGSGGVVAIPESFEFTFGWFRWGWRQPFVRDLDTNAIRTDVQEEIRVIWALGRRAGDAQYMPSGLTWCAPPQVERTRPHVVVGPTGSGAPPLCAHSSTCWCSEKRREEKRGEEVTSVKRTHPEPALASSYETSYAQLLPGERSCGPEAGSRETGGVDRFERDNLSLSGMIHEDDVSRTIVGDGGAIRVVRLSPGRLHFDWSCGFGTFLGLYGRWGWILTLGTVRSGKESRKRKAMAPRAPDLSFRRCPRLASSEDAGCSGFGIGREGAVGGGLGGGVLVRWSLVLGPWVWWWCGVTSCQWDRRSIPVGGSARGRRLRG
ncbi:hypothetical protein FA13DRAFT_1777063 [Coprinellus micaceus]|uniref:Uncharacterized protein n=1 Tax=Coprinellus micaceus TaxID=71717 RepID=A0A4Y7SX53_COPMI|nr:hypothetical protein FA13DRAFT_1777063 [Coprinellus micaceus]